MDFGSAIKGGKKRRTRGLPTPHAEMVIAARGIYHRRTRRLQPPPKGI